MPLGKPLLDALDRMGHGGIILDTAGQVLQINNTAIRLLREHTKTGHPETDLDWARQALKALLRSQDASRFRMEEDNWVTIRRDRDEARRPLVLRAVPIAGGAAPGPHTVVILVDLEATPHPTPEALQKIFGLTPAEARVAVEIGAGRDPHEIAVATHVTVMTVRKQLASVFAKTGTHRQPELVALLARVSILP